MHNINWAAAQQNQQNDLCVQWRLSIRPVWSETSLSAWRNLGSLATHGAHSEDSDQMPRLIWVFTVHFVGFVILRLNSSALSFWKQLKVLNLTFLISDTNFYYFFFRKKLTSTFTVFEQNVLCRWDVYQTWVLEISVKDEEKQKNRYGEYLRIILG